MHRAERVSARFSVGNANSYARRMGRVAAQGVAPPRTITMTTTTPGLRLLVFGPSWGAPSLDAACTKAYAYLLFSGLREGADFTIERTANWHRNLGGELPLLEVCSTGQLAEGNLEVCAALAKCGHDLDAGLSAEQQAESAAFCALIEERLHVALLYSWWEDAVNYDVVVRPALGELLPIPLCYYLPWAMRKRVHSQLARRRCASPDVAYALGETAIAALAVRLGERPYFHGAKPTVVDASAFAYLSAVLRCPLPNQRLRQALQKHASLVRYVERISQSFFGSSEPLLPPMAAPAPIVPSLSAGIQGLRTNLPEAAAPRPGGAATSDAEASASSGKTPRTPKQEAFRRRSRNAVFSAAGATLLYALATDALGRSDEKEAGASDEGV